MRRSTREWKARWWGALGLAAVGWTSEVSAQAAAVSTGEGRVAAAVRRDIGVLAHDSLAGRFTGTAGSDRAASYLIGRLGETGVRPGPAGWRQVFGIAPDLVALREVPGADRPASGVNVIGMIPGSDPVLRSEAVVVGAHYDHLGVGLTSSMSLGNRGEIHNGADDNASGSVALIEIARQLAARPARRTVMVVAFSGEELGLLGSSAYVKSPPFPLERTVAMINLDMVGRLRNDRLLAFGSETAVEFPALLDSLRRRFPFDLAYSGDGYGRSDQQSFYLAGKPVLHLFTDLHEDYHRPSDDAEKINVDGLIRVAEFAAELTRAIADRPVPLTFVNKPPPPPPVAGPVATGGYGAYLGSIPDMSVGGPGVRLSGARPESPAARAGLIAGDVLLGIGRHEIGDLQAMTDALRQHRPGDTVVVRYRRGAAVDSVRVVLGRRGG
ncbi:MAG: M28 family peptidase [Gemmatimonadetes bacterium]|nr:M28 family peptidase [Gemmatimonadota bacterium]